jgi:hypothetical protein
VGDEASPAAKDEASAAAKVYQSMVIALLGAEVDRGKTWDGRAGTLLTASSTLLTLILGLSVLITGKDPVFKDQWAVGLLVYALFAFVSAGGSAVFAQTYGFGYNRVDRKSLKNLAETDELWGKTADFAIRTDVKQMVVTINSLRDVNDTKAALVISSLGSLLLALGLLTSSVIREIYLGADSAWNITDFLRTLHQ